MHFSSCDQLEQSDVFMLKKILDAGLIPVLLDLATLELCFAYNGVYNLSAVICVKSKYCPLQLASAGFD